MEKPSPMGARASLQCGVALEATVQRQTRADIVGDNAVSRHTDRANRLADDPAQTGGAWTITGGGTQGRGTTRAAGGTDHCSPGLSKS